MNSKNNINNNHFSFIQKFRQFLVPGSWFLVLKQCFCLLTTYDLRLTTFIGSWFLVLNGYSQQLAPLSNEYNRRIEYDMARSGIPFFTVIKPYCETSYYSFDTLASFKSKSKPGDSWFKRKLFHESFIQVDSPDFHLYADPVFDFGVGKEINGRNTYINTRGFRAGGKIGKHLAFGTDFYENQGEFNSVIADHLYNTRIAPGEGIARKIDTMGYDFAHASGYLSVSIKKNFNIRLAQGKQFIGDGYRSLLLSDAAYTYPYLNLAWFSKRFLYVWSNMVLQDIDVPNYKNIAPIRRKSASMHLIGFVFNKWQISAVRIELYKNPDSLGRNQMSFGQVNPFFLPFKSSPSNTMILGSNIKFTPFQGIVLYNQLAVIESNKDNVAFQIGSKMSFNLGFHHFYFQAEYNEVPPLAYTSGDKIFNWEHMREPLAHPYGNNFREGILVGTWNYKKLQISGQANFSKQVDFINNLKPYTEAKFPYFQNKEELILYKTEISYFFNSKTLMNATVGFEYRSEISPSNRLSYIYFSFGTRLFNKYYDF